MQVSVESAGGLSRRMKVQVPAERMERAVLNRLEQWSRKAKLAGFRPGKVPMKVLQQHYGDQARQEAMGDLVQETYFEALQQVSLAPAGNPKIEFQSVLIGQDVTYTATFDVYPDIKLAGLDKLSIEKPAAEIAAADIDRMVENLRQQQRRFEPVEREAKEGDALTIDFEGSIDGQPFAGGKGENVKLEVGAGRFLPQLEKGLVGHKAGESFTVPVDFPADYPAEALKGKSSQFQVQIKEVAEARLPELDENFLKAAGVPEGGMEALRSKIEASLKRERDKAVASRVKQLVFDAVLAANPLDLPQGMVAQEIGRMRHEALHRLPQKIQKDAHDNPEKGRQLLPDDIFQKAAERRVALGLLIAEVIRTRDIKLDSTRVDQRIDEMAGDYEKAAEVAKYYRSNREIMQGIEAMVMEEQVVDSLLTGAKVKEKPVDLQTLLAPAHGEAGHVHGPDCGHDH